ncbi:MAG: hypothetical protein ACHQHP_00145 [Bacteroidia bacterium]
MKTKNLMLSGAILMIASSLVFTGCRKKDTTDSDTSGASDNALADQSFNDMHQVSDEASKASQGGGLSGYRMADYNGILSTCATVTQFDTAAKQITVDFGATNCLCNDGRYRRGKIFISYSFGFHHQGYWDSLCSITITTKDPSSGAYNYFVNDNQIKGTRNVTNNGRNAAHHLNWSITENGQVIKANNQGTVTWNATRNREWTAGETTPLNWLDDVYSITGTANGTHANGESFNMTINSPLVFQVGCMYHWVSGTFDYTPGTKPTRHVDFSPPNNGACDGIATVVINSKTYTINF